MHGGRTDADDGGPRPTHLLVTLPGGATGLRAACVWQEDRESWVATVEAEADGGQRLQATITSLRLLTVVELPSNTTAEARK